jgi:hypothetical protein
MEQQITKKKPGIIRRAATGTAKAWAWSIGLPALVKTGKRIAGNVGAAGAHVRRQLNDSPANYRHETFEDAVERLSLDEAHLVKRAKAFNVRSMSWLASMILASGWLAWLAASDALTVQAFVIWLGLMTMTFAKTITWRFRYCQIRDQELYSFGPWLRSPGRW